MRVRQSFLKRWGSCPLQGYFAEVLALPGKQGSKAAFGSCIHSALEMFNKGSEIEDAIKHFLEAWESPSVINLPEIDVWNKYNTYGGLRQKGIDILRGYHERMSQEQRTVVAAEHRFLVPFGRHEITGTVDLLSVRQNHRGKQLLAIEDYKTNTKRPTVAELALNVQFTAYIYATLQPEFWFGDGGEFLPVPNAEWWWEMTQDLPRRGLWIHLWDNAKELDAGGRDDEEFGRLYRLINEIERALEHKVFVPQIGDACTWCDFASDPCPVTPPTREQWEKERPEADVHSWV